MKDQICEHCGETYTPSRGPCRGRKQRFCSVACKGKVYRDGLVASFKGGGINGAGYRVISVGNKRVLEHRHIMALHLGRPLLPTEVVHHRDHDRLNNAIENLELVESRSRHQLMHYTGYRTEAHKQCRKCLAVKPRTEFHAGRKKPGCDPNHTECKACRSMYYAERYRRGLTSSQKSDRR